MTLTGRLHFNSFAPPMAISVTPAALRLAKDYAVSVRRKAPGVDVVVAFQWAESFSSRPRIDGPLIRHGPCLHLWYHERAQYPRGVIRRAGDFEFAIIVAAQIYQSGAGHVIDADADSPTGLVLR